MWAPIFFAIRSWHSEYKCPAMPYLVAAAGSTAHIVRTVRRLRETGRGEGPTSLRTEVRVYHCLGSNRIAEYRTCTIRDVCERWREVNGV